MDLPLTQFRVLRAEDYWALQLPRPTKRSLSECKIAVWSEQPGFPVGAEVRAAIDKVTAGASTRPLASVSSHWAAFLTPVNRQLGLPRLP